MTRACAGNCCVTSVMCVAEMKGGLDSPCACTAGYSLNALVDFPTSDPIEIIKRLMIGSEGTFGFVSRATYNTVPEWPNKVLPAASCMLALLCFVKQASTGPLTSRN